jgi:hypothetical protein
MKFRIIIFDEDMMHLVDKIIDTDMVLGKAVTVLLKDSTVIKGITIDPLERTTYGTGVHVA